jgi:polar amino acid transport system substrate-binding protein
MTRRRAGGLAPLVALVLLAAACGKSGNTTTPATGGSAGGSPTQKALDTVKAGALTVGSCLDYKPFEFYEGGQLKGFDVEIMDAIARKLGLSVEWTKHDFDTIFTALAANQFDAVAAASTIKPERLQVVDFSDPYYNARQSLTVNTSKTPGIASTDDLKSGDTVGTQKGTTGFDWAKENLGPKGITIKTYTAAPDAFTDLEAGQITGVVNDEPSSEAEIEGRASLKVVQAIDTGEHYGIAVAKNRTDIKDAINAALKEIVADGEYKQIFQKYFPGVPVPPEFGG